MHRPKGSARNATLGGGGSNPQARIDNAQHHNVRSNGKSQKVRAVYHGEHGLRTLRELARSYQVASKDLKRVMNRLKALYRSWVSPVRAPQFYSRLSRAVAE
jgi:hypothetical protein